MYVGKTASPVKTLTKLHNVLRDRLHDAAWIKEDVPEKITSCLPLPLFWTSTNLFASTIEPST